jgi:hypothetical protein
MPHRNPGDDVREFRRVNGNARLYLQAGPERGLPYGVYPRLMLVWLTGVVVRSGGNPRVHLGRSLTDFLGKLGLYTAGGARAADVVEQAARLFGSRWTLIRDGAVPKGGTNSSRKNVQVADEEECTFWAAQPDPDHLEYEVVLSDRFVSLLLDRPVPLDPRLLRAVSRSPLGTDLAVWLVHRLGYLTAPAGIAWKDIHAMFGADYARVRDFARAARRELARIALLWPGLKYECVRGRLVLHPSPEHVERVKTARRRRGLE